MAYNAPEGTADMLPAAARLWRSTVDSAAKLFGTYGYEPIYTPLFEITDVFTHGIGEATDVVGKEMFVVRSGENYKRALAEGDDSKLKSKQKLSLRPEGTAGVVRAVVQHNLVEQGAAPAKLFYAGPMFRAERPQKGRLRQFHQIGAECLGSTEPTADAEMIIMLMRFFEKMGVPMGKTRLLINSMGDDNCRPAYRESVRQFILDHEGEMCEECRRRADTNPLRAFDCKNEACAHVMENAPKITDHLCDDCREHYEQVKALLDAAGVKYIEDPTLVRGLDYYTRTVFEVQVVEGMGSQSAIGGGGRYDNLVEELGGPSLHAVGFGMGIERVLMLLDSEGVVIPKPTLYDVFVTYMGAHQVEAFSLVQKLRDAGFKADMDHTGRSLKAQFKYANKMGATLTATLGDEEIASGVVKVKNMATKEEQTIALDNIADGIRNMLASSN